MTNLDPEALLDDLYDQEVGFVLRSTVIKPVHVANGLGRALTNRTYETSALARTLRRWVRKQALGVDEERNPNSRIVEDYRAAFEGKRGSEPNDERLSRLRALTLDVVGADSAVFEQPDKSSYTLSNERFLTRDPSDGRAGLFLARLLTAPVSGPSDAGDVIVSLLQSETDAVTTLVLPLLQFAKPREEIERPEMASRVAKSNHLFRIEHGELASPSLRNLRASYDRLARFERQTGSKLNSLRRLMLFGCFVLHVHAISRWSEQGTGAPQPPIVLDLFDGDVVSIRDASRSSLRAAGLALEGLIRTGMETFVLAEFGADADHICEALGNLDGNPTASALREAVEARLATVDPVEAMTRALAQAALGTQSDHPIAYLIELGRRAGFLAPWANQGRGGKLQKRYTATAEFLETLIAATVEPEKPLEFPEFLNKLRDTFGILVGRPEDDDAIRRNNLGERLFGTTTSINEEDLRDNVEQFRVSVLESGYGKSYADGRTIVTTRPEGVL